MQINGTTALITGGASGMGAATARHLAKLGAKVALFDLNEAALQEVAKEIGGVAFACDVSNEESVSKALASVINAIGAPRIVVNCAGIVHGRRMINKEGRMPLAEYRRVIEINLIGTFNVMSQAVASMADLSPQGDSGERGVVINTASVAAYEGQIGQAAYSSSKGGVVGLTLPAAREFAGIGVRVMTIAPGLVETPMFDKIPPEARSSLAASVPFPKRLAKPSEYAQLVQQIVENEMLNGEIIRLDGAIRMQPK